jgi:hypothetical protein
MGLPLELRDRIWELVLISDDAIEVDTDGSKGAKPPLHSLSTPP